jgi:zeta-carotene desaturase
MYNKTRLQPQRRSEDAGSYLELVVSASKTLVPMSRQQIIDLALRELAEFFPVVRQAKLLKAAVVKEVRATFSVTPGLDAYRPGPVTAWPGIFLAGDWTATGWPSTMEGAVRSGYLAA